MFGVHSLHYIGKAEPIHINYDVLLVRVLSCHRVQGVGKGKAGCNDEIKTFIGGLTDIGNVHILRLCGYDVVSLAPLGLVLPGVAVELKNSPPRRRVEGFVVNTGCVSKQPDRNAARCRIA